MNIGVNVVGDISNKNWNQGYLYFKQQAQNEHVRI